MLSKRKKRIAALLTAVVLSVTAAFSCAPSGARF